MEPAGGFQGGEVVPRAAPVLTQETIDLIVQSAVKSAVAAAVWESTDASTKAVANVNVAAAADSIETAAAAVSVGRPAAVDERSCTTRRSP